MNQAVPENVTELLRALISIPSVNPDGDAGTDRTGEGEIARYVGDFLSACGASVEFEEVKPDRPNVIGKFPSNGSGKPKVLLAPHTDTVTVTGMTIDPFAAEVRNGRVYGRGACDTKGTMAAMLWALKENAGALADLSAEIHFVGLMSEETGQDGSRHFGEHHPDYAFALVGEPTGCDIVYKHKGCTWAKITTTGQAVHGSTPERGENAITAMAKIVQALDTDFRSQIENAYPADPVLGTPTINIGQIRGGVRTNIVADYCELRVDLRSTPQMEQAGGALAALTELVNKVDPKASVELQGIVAKSLDTDPDNSFVGHLKEAGGELVGAPWFCDAAHLSEVGIPSVAAGPGDIAQAHTEDEWISIEELEAGVDFYGRFLRSLS